MLAEHGYRGARVIDTHGGNGQVRPPSARGSGSAVA